MIAILQYNAGNTQSVAHALERLGCPYQITDDPVAIKAAGKVILPGVGEAGSAMHYLKEKALDKTIRELTQPVLGICLGLQLLCRYSEEGATAGLGIFPADVRRFPPLQLVPHTGWNNISGMKGLLFEGISAGDDVYFVHSFYAGLCPYTIATCDYILPFSAAMQWRNFYATQFHPEKSGSTGQQILHNFLKL